MRNKSLLFDKSVNEMNEDEDDEPVFVEEDFPPKGIRRVKSLPGETNRLKTVGRTTE